MYVNARCPHCQTLVVNDSNVAGRVVACPKCHQAFQMPDASAQAAAHPMATPAYTASPLFGHGPKNSGIAAVLSFFWTGLGQIYNGQIFLGLAMMGVQFVFILLCFVIIGFPLLFILWIWSIYQAYNTSEAINRGERV